MRVRASGSFRRYTIQSGHSGTSGGADVELVRRLHENRFRSIDHAGSEVSSVGWCRPDGTVPRQFDEDDLRLGEVVALALRIDRKRLPAGALRIRRREAEAAERREVGERIAPARRREIADKIETELVARMVPSTAVHPLLWHGGRRELLVGTTSDPANVSARALFRETFEASIEPLVTATLAPRLAPPEAAIGLGGLAPATFTQGGVAVVSDSAAFLGRELLLWLWFRCETVGGAFALPELGEVGVAFDQLLELGAAQEEGEGKVSLRSDAPTLSPEAASALQGGKLPTRARLLLARGEKTFEVTLAADSLDLEGVKVSAESEAISDENLRAGDEQRAGWLFELCSLVDALFAGFLKLRLDRGFEQELLPSIRNWIASRGRPRARAATR